MRRDLLQLNNIVLSCCLNECNCRLSQVEAVQKHPITESVVSVQYETCSGVDDIA